MAFLKIGVAAVLFALAGCATEADEPALTDDDVGAEGAAKRPAYGVVTVERTEGAGVSRASVSAKFMRVAPADRQLAEDVVSARAVVPAPGECATLSSLEGLGVTRLAAALEGADAGAVPQGSIGEGFNVELLDVGDVSLVVHEGDHTPQALVPLSPRAFPDVGDLASGVFYTTPDATVPLPQPATTSAYELTSSGATAVDAFLLDVGSMPERPSDLSVDGVEIDGALSAPVDASHELTLGWRKSDAELIYVDVLGAAAFRCSFADAGSAVLPSGVLSEADRGADITVAVHRVTERLVQLRRSADTAADVDLEGAEARVRFDLASAIRLSVK
jgi:hypothetical protein